jgi:hypothetical protein
MMAKEIVSMYRAVWIEVERQFPKASTEERQQIYSFISPFINNMCTMAFSEGLTEEISKPRGKQKKKR